MSKFEALLELFMQHRAALIHRGVPKEEAYDMLRVALVNLKDDFVYRGYNAAPGLSGFRHIAWSILYER